MAEKFWIQDFESQIDRIRVHFMTTAGEVTSIRVIQYEAYINGEWHAIVRYDEAHGFFHQDVMAPGGKKKKTPQPAQNKGVVLNEAINDIKQRWQVYRLAYEEALYG